MSAKTISDFPSHYYEASDGPFQNLSDLPFTEAEEILEQIRQRGSQWRADYLSVRRGLEERVHQLFILKGGQSQRKSPHYLILGVCPWVLRWYPHRRELRIPLIAFHAEIVSFTYGDTFPAMCYQDGKLYRGQVYPLAELPALIEQYGLPQDWNTDGKYGPDRYVEAQFWADEPLAPYMSSGTWS